MKAIYFNTSCETAKCRLCSKVKDRKKRQGFFCISICSFFKGLSINFTHTGFFYSQNFQFSFHGGCQRVPHFQGTTMKYSNWMWQCYSVSLSQLVTAGYCFPSLIPSHWLVATGLTCPVWAEITVLLSVASPSFLTHLGSSAAISRIAHMHWSWQDPPKEPLISQHEIRERVVTELMSLVCIVSSVQVNGMCGAPCTQKIASSSYDHKKKTAMERWQACGQEKKKIDQKCTEGSMLIPTVLLICWIAKYFEIYHQKFFLGETNLGGRSEEMQISRKQDKTIQDYQILNPVNIHLPKHSWNSSSSHSLMQKWPQKQDCLNTASSTSCLDKKEGNMI